MCRLATENDREYEEFPLLPLEPEPEAIVEMESVGNDIRLENTTYAQYVCIEQRGEV